MTRAFRAWVVSVAVGVAGAACSGDDPACIEGVCPDRDEARSFPGPCRAGVLHPFGPRRLDFEYDAAGRVTRAGYVVRNEEERDFFHGTEWSYAEDGRPLQILRYGLETTELDSPHVWTFDDQEVRITHGGVLARYDRAMFAFTPLIGIKVAAPTAELGLVQTYNASYEWTVDGTRRIRRQVSSLEPGPLATSTYELDARGRIVSITHDKESDATIDSSVEIVYDGELLLRWGTMEWSYDLGGNVVEGRGPDSDYREVYEYGCW